MVRGYICTLLFAGFHVNSFRGLVAICESFARENLDINGYARKNGQHMQI